MTFYSFPKIIHYDNNFRTWKKKMNEEASEKVTMNFNKVNSSTA